MTTATLLQERFLTRAGRLEGEPKALSHVEGRPREPRSRPSATCTDSPPRVTPLGLAGLMAYGRERTASRPMQLALDLLAVAVITLAACCWGLAFAGVGP